MNGATALLELVRRARRRRAFHAVLHRIALVCSAALGVSVILLIAGADLLSWYWPALLFAVACIVLLTRGPRRHEPSDYELAQDIDRRLGLHDSLSTALYFVAVADVRAAADETVCDQRRIAEKQAMSADLSRAIPFAARRPLYVSGGLALMVVCLFAARYGIYRTLDLRPSIVHAAFAGVSSGSPAAQQHASAAAQRIHPDTEKLAESVEPALASGPSTSQNPAANATVEPVQSTLRAGSGSPGPLKLNPGESPEDTAAANGNESARQNDSSARNRDQGAPAAGMKPGGRQDSQAQGGAQAQSSPAENSSLMDRMRDAMAGLLSKLKMQQNSPGAGRQSSDRDSSRNSSGARNNSPAAGAQGKRQDDSSSPSGQDGANAEAARATEASNGARDGKSAQSSDSADSKSGIGAQDGAKDPHLAEQLAAMGKISEIIGRRSRTVTGEVMVEVRSGKEQQLRTEYSGRRAAHSDTTGEISRDEVPLAYQQYIQDYFDQIRKLPPPPSDSRR
ncbi:MAG TPA: hypothetical protein VFA04_25830 [Bryobacteraceae bacterium]|nr:hypothetical protein [Bryobacteraceae bacterium]